MDLLAPSIYWCSVLFYNSPPTIKKPQTISQNLKKSLSETLTRFYPFAGKIQKLLIECNDEGFVFIDAKVNCSLSDYLKNPDPESLKHFLPAYIISKEAAVWPVLTVQVSFFKCGGFPIGVCISHKICDAASMGAFISSWAAIGRGDADVPCPDFSSASFFPALDFSLELDEMTMLREKCVTRRYVFEASKIADLKILATIAAKIPNPTRVEVVTAALFKAVIKASRSNSSSVRPSILSQAVNLRRRNIPLLSENVIGNPLFHFMIKCEEEEIDFKTLVSELRRSKQECDKMCEEKVRSGQESSSMGLSNVMQLVELLSKGSMDVYFSTSLCRLGLYESDFGTTGKPVWATNSGTSEFKNKLVTLDAKDGVGIECWLTLTEKYMDLVDQDQELLHFASIDPSVLI